MHIAGTEFTAKETKNFLEKENIILYHTSSEIKGTCDRHFAIKMYSTFQNLTLSKLLRTKCEKYYGNACASDGP